MASNDLPSKAYSWVTTQRNLTIIAAILIAVPTAYAFHSFVGGTEQAGSFLLLMILAVGVPSAYDEYWSHYEQMWKTIVWITVACLVATTEFTGFYLVGTDLVHLSPFIASVGAFLVTGLGNLAWLLARQ